jgi:hypothetical protein
VTLTENAITVRRSHVARADQKPQRRLNPALFKALAQVPSVSGRVELNLLGPFLFDPPSTVGGVLGVLRSTCMVGLFSMSRKASVLSEQRCKLVKKKQALESKEREKISTFIAAAQKRFGKTTAVIQPHPRGIALYAVRHLKNGDLPAFLSYLAQNWPATRSRGPHKTELATLTRRIRALDKQIARAENKSIRSLFTGHPSPAGGMSGLKGPISSGGSGAGGIGLGGWGRGGGGGGGGGGGIGVRGGGGRRGAAGGGRAGRIRSRPRARARKKNE